MGLDIFDGLPHLELGFRLIKMSEIFSCQFYVVDVQGSMNGIPYVQMTRCGTDLKDAIQKFIPILCEPSMPKLECPFRGEVFHVNSKACAWFRQYSDDALAYKIAQTLQRYQKLENSRKIQMKLFGLHDTNVDQCESESSSRSSSLASFHNSNNTISTSVSQEVKKQISWKGSIFVTQYEEDLYRVKVTRLLQRNKVEVEFIDFGNRDTVSKSQLIPASTIDENLNFIPAQCLRGRIAGFYKINVSQFWRLMPSRSQPAVNIVIKNMKGDEENGMEIEIFRLHAETSISETWRASSPESLVLAWYNLKPAEENSTGATGIRNVSQSRLALEGRNLDHIQNSLAHLNFEPCRH
ncbi:uncharacterized protein LOC118438752 [Folsomia candida]|nr:uncharacterized protein LOC118438752 [Folsomia candida]